MDPITPAPFFSRFKKILATTICAAVAVGIIATYIIFLQSPKNFPEPGYIHISKGELLSDVAYRLAQEGYIKSPLFFTVSATLLGGDKGILAGDYYLEKKINTLALADRLARGDFRLVPIKVTLPEGTTVSDMAMILMKRIPGFDGAKFAALAQTQKKEGYLFPDTYFFLPNVTAEEVIKVLSENFTKKTEILKIAKNKLAATVILASIIEEEGATTESRRMISGILQKRLAEGMLLQVDAPFAYAIGKSTYDLTLEDLKSTSPYNTYRYKGLTPTPISNPGLDSLQAAITPTPSPYYFYLTERDGTIHYARTYEEHLVNKAKYIK
ncbi:MAG: endolytic transglycosylase MltG [Candidatus Taylorbacteria bacterium]|nr:endolytic transglycosylase MltG [Candidatus Taylorbacteria bacterium]